MAQEIGPEIPIDGKRPDWLGDDECCAIFDDSSWLGLGFEIPSKNWHWHEGITLIRLRADHPYYQQQASDDSDDYVRVKRLSASEIARAMEDTDHDVQMLFDQLGISRPDSMIDQFTRETGIVVTDDIRRALEWSANQ